MCLTVERAGQPMKWWALGMAGLRGEPDEMRMTEVERGDDLPKEAPGFLWRQAALLHEVIEQFTTRNVLHHEVSDKDQRESHWLWLLVCWERKKRDDSRRP